MSDEPIVETITPERDGCDILNRTNLYTFPLGIVPVIQHVVRDSRGNPIDLTVLDSDESASTNVIPVLLRIKEFVAPAGAQNPVHQYEGTIIDAENGIVQVELDEDAVPRAGIYQTSLALSDSLNRTRFINNPVVWVERSLFVLDSTDTTYNLGPPNLQEVRQALLDHGGAENSLLDDVEFTDDQIAMALTRPVQQWNETPPPIPNTDTRLFPFREAWLKAVCGYLLVTAAHNYRRNYLNTSVGGINVDDKQKEGQYLQSGMMLLEEWKNFIQNKKIQLNLKYAYGSVGSTYGGVYPR